MHVLFSSYSVYFVYSATACKIEKALRAACSKLIEAESLLNKLDSLCGDGDCGTSCKQAADAILKAVDSKRLAFSYPKSLCLQLSRICEHSVGGTSGALYALLFGAGSRAFESEFDDQALRRAIAEGLHSVIYYGHAKPGHRTLVDPLYTAAKSISSSWEELVKVTLTEPFKFYSSFYFRQLREQQKIRLKWKRNLEEQVIRQKNNKMNPIPGLRPLLYG